jgi:hypothetical protein
MANAVKRYTLPVDVARGKGLVYVVDSTPARVPISRTVLLDGDDEAATIGSLLPGTYIYVQISPGHHRIKMPEWSSYELVIEVEEGDLLFLCPIADQKTGKNLIQQVDGVVGRYHVMRFTPGNMVKSVEQK